MDKEQQIRLNFLDEAEDCFHNIESVFLALANQVADTQQLDIALRAAHSVKGGAGMMGFLPLSKIAHSLEDFLKILRVRYHSTQISIDVETLLLQALDRMRQVSELHRQSKDIEDSWLHENVNPIFEGLTRHLGELQDDDENQLLNQTEGIDATLLMFEDGVEKILDEFEEKVKTLTTQELPDALFIVSETLIAMGRISNIEPFIQLCESIQQQVTITESENLASLAQEALTLWRRSHALIARGSFEKLPSQLDGADNFHLPDEHFSDDFMDFNWEDHNLSELDDFRTLENLEEQEFAQIQEFSETELEPDFELLTDISWEEEDLTELQNAFSEENLAINSEVLETLIPELIDKTEEPLPQIAKTPKQTGKTVRVPVEQLYQFNSLFGKLVLERNRVNLRLDQLKNFATLMRNRMNKLEQSNTQLRKWYDRASLEGIVPVTNESVPIFSPSVSDLQVANTLISNNNIGQFDALEMDRYSDLHLISQEQIETIVQLQEVSTDIELGLQEISQAIQDLNQTTRAMQGNVTRTQMLPFADVVKPFPRLIRDLNLQFGKNVILKIEGETTLLDRAIVETLNAPLMHLIRNAYAHGIEDLATRIASGKFTSGTITLQAVNRGTQTIITVSDDGGGINLDKIGDRLRKMGMTEQEINKKSPSEIIDYIFQPGFTTTDQVTELSGRGVGMDVVRKNIEEIRGNIEVETIAGKGTTFIFKVPFSLSILRVILVERAGMVFAIPADSIREVVSLQAEKGSSVNDLNQVKWQKQTIPLVRLEESLIFNHPHKLFHINEEPLIDTPTAFIVGDGDNMGAIHIDRFWSEQEVTIRSIDSPLPLPKGFISSLILGDGKVLPLIDPVLVLQGCLEHNLSQDQSTFVSIDQDYKKTITERVNTILIVDDSINVRRYLALTLEKAGYQVEQAKNGQEAVDKLFGGLSVSAVICDIEMPRLDGYGVLEEVKAKPEFKSLPIAMLTSRSNEKHRKLAMNLGASAYFSKPYNEQELLQKIAELINLPYFALNYTG